MRTTIAARPGWVAGAFALLLSGCVLPMPEGDSPSSTYSGTGSGYTGSTGPNRDDRVEDRGPLPSGTYTESCRDMRVDHDRHYLEATCRRLDGRWRETRLNLRDCDRGIVNRDGWLECPRQELARLPAGSYQESCRDLSVENRRLAARCRRKNGQWQDAVIDLSRCKSPI